MTEGEDIKDFSSRSKKVLPGLPDIPCSARSSRSKAEQSLDFALSDGASPHHKANPVLQGNEQWIIHWLHEAQTASRSMVMVAILLLLASRSAQKISGWLHAAGNGAGTLNSEK